MENVAAATEMISRVLKSWETNYDMRVEEHWGLFRVSLGQDH